MNFIEMTHTCEDCDEDDCATSCKNGTCALEKKEIYTKTDKE